MGLGAIPKGGNGTPLDVVILAGGLGTRLREAVPDLPKVLAPVRGRPFLDILLAALGRCEVEISTVVLAVGYMADKIRTTYQGRTDFGFEIGFSEEAEPLGTAGALGLALPLTWSDPVLVLNGDTFAEVDLEGFVALHREKEAAATIAVRSVSDAGRYGRVTFDDAGRVSAFEEKRSDGGAGWINAGVYLFSRCALKAIPPGRPVSVETETLPALLGAGTYAYQTAGAFIDIGLPDTFTLAQTFFSEE